MASKKTRYRKRNKNHQLGRRLKPTLERLEDRLALTVAFFDNPSFVSPSELAVRDTLQDLSVPFESFDGTSAADVSAALSDATVLFIPELENDLVSNLDAATRSSIRDFVDGGGSIVINGANGDADTALLNGIFFFSVSDGDSDIASSRTSSAVGTAFADDPAALPNNETISSLAASSLPAAASSIYVQGDSATVAVLPFGSGNIVYLGWDWDGPVGGFDGGWVEVLESSIETASPSNGEISGTIWNDLNGDGVFDSDEPGRPDVLVYLDENQNERFDEGEISTVTGPSGEYSFNFVVAGNYEVRADIADDLRQTFPTPDAGSVVDAIAENASNVTALVPARFDFSDGDVGTSINDGGNDMFDGGNILNTNRSSSIPYTNGVVTSSARFFGEGSQYFTAKHDGLFVMGAQDISIDSFDISGNNGADGGGTANGTVLTTDVGGRHTIYVKRVFGTTDPSINNIIIVPGDGAGIRHTFAADTNDGAHAIIGLADIDELYFMLVASQNGGFVSDGEILAIAEEFLLSLPPISIHSVTIGSGESFAGLDFGSQVLPGEIRGTKWNDANEDGIFDADESGVAGVTVFLDANDDGLLTDGEISTVTESDGSYVLSEVPVGVNIVREVVPDGWEQTFPGTGSNSGTPSIAFFNDPGFVDGIGEPVNVQATLTERGHDFETFTGVDAPAISTALEDANVLLVPELEVGSLAFALDADAQNEIRAFVADGGGLIIHGDVGSNDSSFLNEVFGWNISDGSVADVASTRTDAASGTFFEDEVDVLPGNNGTYFLDTASLPDDALSIYASDTSTSVSVLPFGQGNVVYLGWDWFDGLADGGWLDALDAAIVTATSNFVPGFYAVDVSANAVIDNLDFGNVPLPGVIGGTVWNDANGDGVFDSNESGIPGVTVYLDENSNEMFDDGEPSVITGPSGEYQFGDVTPGDYLIRAELPTNSQQTFPSATSGEIVGALAENAADISSLVPSRFDFDGGDDTLPFFIDGQLFSLGNIIGTDVGGFIPYTNGVITPGDFQFGEGSEYFTAKHDGLFVLGAENISISNFNITGNTVTGGLGTADATILTTNVGGEHTIYVKRIFGIDTPSINNIIIVPGDGTGITQTFSADTDFGDHAINSLEDIEELYFLLVSSASGGFISDGEILSIAEEFLRTVPAAGSASRVQLDPGGEVVDANFGNLTLPGAIRGTAWNDLDGDGVFAGEEPGRAGITVFLDSNNDGLLNNGERSTTTDIAGNYVFTDVAAGTHVLAEVQQAGWQQTFPGLGRQTVLLEGNDIEGVNFGSLSSAVLRFESSTGSFNVTGGETIQVTVTAVSLPQAATGYQFELGASDDGLALSNWTTNPDVWQLIVDDSLDSAVGDTFVSAASTNSIGDPAVLGTFDVTIPDAPVGTTFLLSGASFGAVGTRIFGAAGPLSINDFGDIELVIGERIAPQITSVDINTGITDPQDLPDKGAQPTSWSHQRSDVRSIVVTFDEDIASATAADITLVNLGVNSADDPDSLIVLTDGQITTAANTLTITFAPGQLSDGILSLEIQPTLTDVTGNPLDGDGDGVGGDAYSALGDELNGLFQLTGDWNGDGRVSDLDFPSFLYWTDQTVPTAPRYMDLNADDAITIADFQTLDVGARIRLGLPGDANRDGNVDSNDLGLLLNNFNDVVDARWRQGDFNDDGLVDSTDLGLLLLNFGFEATEVAATAAEVPATQSDRSQALTEIYAEEDEDDKEEQDRLSEGRLDQAFGAFSRVGTWGPHR